MALNDRTDKTKLFFTRPDPTFLSEILGKRTSLGISGQIRPCPGWAGLEPKSGFSEKTGKNERYLKMIVVACWVHFSMFRHPKGR